MSTQGIPPSGDGPSKTLDQQLEVLKFLREEAEANRQRLNYEAEADRSLLKHILWVVSIPLSIALVAAGWFGISSIASLKQAIQEQAQTEGKQAIAQAKDQLQTELHDNVNEQFQTPQIKETIHGAAIEATKNEANAMIRDAVKTQVTTAVAAQSGQIQKVAVQAVNEKVEGAIAPLANQAKESLSALHVQQLIAEADSDNASAIDELIGLRSEGPTNQQAMISGVIADRRRYEHDSGVRRGGGNRFLCLDPKSADFSSRLRSANAGIRLAALADCTAWYGSEFDTPEMGFSYSPVRIQEELAPLFVNTALRDSSITVRAQAINGLNIFFESSPGYPHDGLDLIDLSGLKRWWQEHKSDYAALEWIARMRYRPQFIGFDSVYFFNELTKVKTPSSVTNEAIQNILSTMRRYATEVNDEPLSNLKTRLGRDSCESVKNDLKVRIDDWNKQPTYGELSDTYGVFEIAFLKSCPADLKYLPVIADFASRSPSLDRRYGSIVTINIWQGTHFDPFNTKDFEDWWTNHKSDYQK
jgi:hypothetical protein